MEVGTSLALISSYILSELRKRQPKLMLAVQPVSRSDSTVLLRPLNTVPVCSLKTRLKRRLVRSLHQLTYCTGLSSLYARLRAGVRGESVATVMMYHSIPAADEQPWMDPCNCLPAYEFERQMHFLAHHRHVISVERLVQKLRDKETLQRGTVVITFDDGYLNNLRVAAPILARYRLPATIYLATSYITNQENQWIDTLYSAFRARTRHLLGLSNLSLANWDLSEQKRCEKAYRMIANHLITCTPKQRQTVLESINRQLAPAAYPPRLTMNWDEVRELRHCYPNITLGVHTANHLDLSTHYQHTDREMELSIAHLLAETGERPQHLAFPYNRYNAKAQGQVAAHLRSAMVTATDPVVRSQTSPYALPRLEAPQSLLMLKSWTNGGFPDVTQRLFGRVWARPY